MFGGREEYLEVLGAVFRKNKDAGAGGTQATAGKARVAEMEGIRRAWAGDDILRATKGQDI